MYLKDTNTLSYCFKMVCDADYRFINCVAEWPGCFSYQIYLTSLFNVCYLFYFTCSTSTGMSDILILFKVKFEVPLPLLDMNGVINPYHAEFLKWNNQPSIYRTFHYHF